MSAGRPSTASRRTTAPRRFPPRRRRLRSLAAVAPLLAFALVAGACSSPETPISGAPPPAPAEERSVFVALGGDETLTRGLDDGFRVAWTRQVFNELPRSAVYVNVATEDATAQDGLDQQLDTALALQPTVATVWFGAGDSFQGTDPDRFVEVLTILSTRLRDAGVHVLLVADTVDISTVPFVPLIEQVAAATGATYVAAPGPNGNPGEAAAQDGIADAVIAGLEP